MATVDGNNKSSRFVGLPIEIGGKYQKLTVVGRAAPSTPSERHYMYECVCECGGKTIQRSTYLMRGRVTSCGCSSIEALKKRITKHSKYGTPLYRQWMGMLARCRNPKAVGYHRYGGRGISVCERWLSYENFYQDMHPRPSKEHSLGRIDNDGNYCPENVRWETRHSQSNNRSTSRFVTFDGKTLTLADWARHLGLKPKTLCERFRKGMSVDLALSPRRLTRTARRGGQHGQSA